MDEMRVKDSMKTDEVNAWYSLSRNAFVFEISHNDLNHQLFCKEIVL